jgi:hypothetical protein
MENLRTSKESLSVQSLVASVRSACGKVMMICLLSGRDLNSVSVVTQRLQKVPRGNVKGQSFTGMYICVW